MGLIGFVNCFFLGGGYLGGISRDEGRVCGDRYNGFLRYTIFRKELELQSCDFLHIINMKYLFLQVYPIPSQIERAIQKSFLRILKKTLYVWKCQ